MVDLLTVSEMSVTFGSVKAVDCVSFAVRAGEALAIAGPNGAGKSTLIDAITGFANASAGRVAMVTGDGRERDLTSLPAEQRVRLGIGRTFQHGGLLDDATALDNVLCGVPSAMEGGWLSALVCSSRFRRQALSARSTARAALDEIGLPAYLADRRIRDMAPADRQLVALCRALVASPVILFLDEVGAGTDQETKKRIGGVVREFSRRPGRAVVFVEHDLAYLREVADRLIFMTQGRTLTSGEPAEVLGKAEVLNAYIGDEGYEAK